MLGRRKSGGNPPQDMPAHTPGIKSGNSKLPDARQSGHLADGRRTSEASTGVNADARRPIDPRMPNLTPG